MEDSKDIQYRFEFSVDGVVFNRFLGDRYDPSRIRATQNLLVRDFQKAHTGIPINRVPTIDINIAEKTAG